MPVFPAFWTTLTEVNKIEVFQVHYFKEFATKVTAVCENQDKQLGSLDFKWSEVTAQVQGLLPIFEEVVDLTHGVNYSVKPKLKITSTSVIYTYPIETAILTALR